MLSPRLNAVCIPTVCHWNKLPAFTRNLVPPSSGKKWKELGEREVDFYRIPGKINAETEKRGK